MTVTITSWPAHTKEPTPVPLPRLGLCAVCEGEIRIRGNGLLYAHDCTDDGQLPLLVLKPTFARWLWMQSKRRDDYTNLATLVAGRYFRACTRSPKITSVEVDWATAEELHGRLHLTQLARTGSELMRPNGERCGGVCRDLQKIAAIYERLIATADPAVTDSDDAAPIVRVFRRAAGWVLPDFTDLADCTSNFHREQDGRPACTATAVWKVVEDHGMHLTIGFWCDTDLPEQHKAQAEAA
ncbi:hypothetical protein OG747_36385 [Streptomyces sp. NBC_01384]|uniref:hypothetical protein n=1 Tax=Streptomyces sp. NBC_01384 TaxID=2903847 RepID=UPI00325104DB